MIEQSARQNFILLSPLSFAKRDWSHHLSWLHIIAYFTHKSTEEQQISNVRCRKLNVILY
jgi:hypothetical protein